MLTVHNEEQPMCDWVPNNHNLLLQIAHNGMPRFTPVICAFGLWFANKRASSESRHAAPSRRDLVERVHAQKTFTSHFGIGLGSSLSAMGTIGSEVGGVGPTIRTVL